MLNGDTYTLATEVPVWLYPEERDLSQRRKVATQLNLYALALAKRANLSLSLLRCAWFDEEDFFSFNRFHMDNESGAIRKADDNLQSK